MSEQIGPVATTNYSVSAKTLSEVNDKIGSGQPCGCTQFAASFAKPKVKDDKVVDAKVVVKLSVRMPSWSAPSTVGPKTKKEWQRAIAELQKHENEHVKAVEKCWKGVGKQMVGMSPDEAMSLFNKKVKECQSAQDALDPFTVEMDLGIEDEEIEEMEAAKKKK
jgi:predicted secreted Zn-dependent protease